MKNINNFTQWKKMDQLMLRSHAHHAPKAPRAVWVHSGHSTRSAVDIFNALRRGGRTRLPKFKFSAKFPIGLHVILQIQIKKFENDSYIMWKIILTENPSRFNIEPLLK